MTTDNRTNEPTEAQVEAAAIAFTCETQDEWERSPEPYKEMIREDMRAALVAAQGAAPGRDTRGFIGAMSDFMEALTQELNGDE